MNERGCRERWLILKTMKTRCRIWGHGYFIVYKNQSLKRRCKRSLKREFSNLSIVRILKRNTLRIFPKYHVQLHWTGNHLENELVFDTYAKRVSTKVFHDFAFAKTRVKTMYKSSIAKSRSAQNRAKN